MRVFLVRRWFLLAILCGVTFCLLWPRVARAGVDRLSTSLLVATALVFAMIGILIAFPKAKDVMATVASGALAMVAVMTLPRRPTA